MQYVYDSPLQGTNFGKCTFFIHNIMDSWVSAMTSSNPMSRSASPLHPFPPNLLLYVRFVMESRLIHDSLTYDFYMNMLWNHRIMLPSQVRQVAQAIVASKLLSMGKNTIRSIYGLMGFIILRHYLMAAYSCVQNWIIVLVVCRKIYCTNVVSVSFLMRGLIYNGGWKGWYPDSGSWGFWKIHYM